MHLCEWRNLPAVEVVHVVVVADDENSAASFERNNDSTEFDSIRSIKSARREETNRKDFGAKLVGTQGFKESLPLCEWASFFNCSGLQC